MNLDEAKNIHDLAIEAIKNLSSILQASNSYDEYEAIKKGVGLSIGKIQMDILEVIYKNYPELDDL